MVWRSILVHVDDDPRCDERIELAARLARDRDARLAAVAPSGWIEWMVPVLPAPAGADELAAALALLRRQAEAAAQHFRERCTALAVEAPQVWVDEGDAANAVVARGHGSDLVVIGQADPEQPGHRARQAFVERVVLQASRPVLLVPYAGHFEHAPGRRIVAAWDGGREAARALADAMPLLCAAGEVQLAAFAGPFDDDPSASLQPIAQWLLWHGVQARTIIQRLGGIDVGDALLSLAADADADLVVMGAYGHSRWSERALGGATRSVLRQMTVPVLMSH